VGRAHAFRFHGPRSRYDEEEVTRVTVPSQVADLVTPIVDAEGLELFDLELSGGVLKVTVEREGGVGLDAIAPLTRALSRALDEHDPITSSYTLEVSSPGLERPLRTPEHFRWAVGKQVAVKVVAGIEGDRRFTGTVREADADGVTIQLDTPAGGDPASPSDAASPGAPEGGARRLPYDQIDKARTVFEWGPAPKPGKATPAAKPAKPGKASSEKRAKAS
jgi:ribosome maturation factor RimP